MPTIPPNNTSGLYGIDGSSIPIDNNIIANNISATGNVTVDGFLLVDGSITTNSNFVGNLVGNLIGNISLAGSNTQVIFNDSGVTGGSNAFTFNKATNAVAITGTLSATGNITGDYILGNGSQLTGLPATYSNANVVSLMASFGSNTISTSGNITGGYILGNGSQLTGLPQQYGNANVAAYLASGTNTQNIVTSGTVQGNILQTAGAGGNITGANYISANYFVGDGSLLTNVSGNLAGNMQGNILGNGFGISNIAFLSVTGASTLANLAITGGANINVGNNRITNVATPSSGTDAATKDYVDGVASSGFTIEDDTANTTTVAGGDTLELLGTANQVSVAITATDQVTFGLPSAISVSGNITGGNINTAGALSATGNVNAGNSLITNDLTVGGTIYGTFSGNIAGNLVVPGANTQIIFNNAGNAGASSDFTFDDGTNVMTLNGLANVLGNVQGGNITTVGLMSAAGNITANYYLGNGSQLTGITSDYGNANVANYLPTFGGNVGAGNLVMTSTSGVAYVNNITGLAGQPVSITADGTEDIHLDADSIRIGDNNTDATIVTHGTGDLILRTNEGSATEGNIILRDGASGNIDIQTNGTGVVNITGTAGLRVADGISAVGNITGNYFLGNGSQLTGITTAAGGSNTQLQFNDSGSFAGNANVTFNKATGNLAAGNLVFLTSNVNATNGVYQNWLRPANNYAANTATSSLMQSGRILIGDGLGNTWGGGGQGDFGVTYEQFTNYRSTNLGVAQRYTRTDNGVPSSGVALVHQIDVSGNVGTSNSNSRIVGFASTLFPGGNNGSGNLVSTNPLMMRAQTAFINFGQQNANFTSNEINVQACSSTQSGISMATGNSVVTHHIGFYDVTTNSSGNANAIGNHYGMSFAVSGTSTIKNWHGVHLQNGTGNGWGTSTLPSDSYRFLNNQDWRSSSVIGPIESSLGRVYTIGTTTGNVTIEWPNGTTQYLKPTGNVTLAYANATVSSNGNLLHTVNLIVEQGTTAYTVTLPTGNANILYASGNSTVPSTANAVTFINVAAGNINGVTKYMTSIGPEYT